MSRGCCAICLCRGVVAPAAPSGRWDGIPLCLPCLAEVTEQAEALPAGPQTLEPLVPIVAAVLRGEDASLLPYGRPADAVVH